MKKETRHFFYIALTLLLIIIFRGTFTIVACDDAFITFRYSDNLASGNGMVFNEGERILGTTTPLFALLLAFFRVLGVDIVLMSHVLSIIFHFCISLMILLILENRGFYLAGIIGAFGFALDKLVMTAYGMETNFYIALFMVSFYFLLKKRIHFSVILASLMTLCRADGGLWLLILFLIILLKHKRDFLKTFIISLIVLIPWFTFSLFYFGELLPHTISVKVLNVSFFVNSFIIATPYYVKEFYSYIILFSLIGLVLCFRSKDKLLLLFYYDAAYLIIFTLIRAPHCHWYFIPLVPSIYIFAGRAFEELITRVLKLEENSYYENLKKMFNYIPLMLVIYFIIQFIFNIDRLGVADTRSKAFYYKNAGIWLKDNTTDDATVMTAEIGIIGYYSERKIIDMGGLVTILDDFSEKTPGALASHFKPDFYVTGTDNTGRFVKLNDLLYNLAAVTEGNMGIYKRQDYPEDQSIVVPDKDNDNNINKKQEPIKLEFLRDFTGRE